MKQFLLFIAFQAIFKDMNAMLQAFQRMRRAHRFSGHAVPLEQLEEMSNRFARESGTSYLVMTSTTIATWLASVCLIEIERIRQLPSNPTRFTVTWLGQKHILALRFNLKKKHKDEKWCSCCSALQFVSGRWEIVKTLSHQLALGYCQDLGRSACG